MGLPEAVLPARIRRARAIQGWMDEGELEWLAGQAEKHCCIVEIGSWKGRSTVALAESTPGIVFAVDTWVGSKEHWENVNITPEDVGPDGNLFKIFRKNTRDLPVIPVQLASVQAAKLFKSAGISFDMIFIDASHDYESVKQDIEMWRPLLDKDGVFCGHDYGSWPDVEIAVQELLDGIHIPVGSIWSWEG